MTFRYATREDIDCIMRYIRCLAIHERRLQDVTVTKEKLEKCLFLYQNAYVVLAEIGSEVVGYAFFYPVIGSYSCSVRMHIEDIFINAPLRGNGYGRAFMRHLAKLAKDMGWIGLEWNALDYNTEAIGFYESIGAKRETERVYYNLTLSSGKD